MKNIFRCIHRHPANEHPACFAQGKVLDKRPMYEQINHPWYKANGSRIGYLDIEADGLKADFSTMLSWCIKERDGETYYDVITQNDMLERKGDADKRIIESLVNTLSNFNIVVTYYGGDFRYDLPFIRTKAIHYGLEFPGWKALFQYDLYAVVKQKLCLSRNTLDAACDYFGIVGKTPILKSAWRNAKYGDKEALEEVLSHNKGDVEILEALHKKLEPFKLWSKTSI